jgi:hypothetical protein
MEGDVVKGKEARVEKQLVLRVQEQGRRVILGVASSIELELFVIVPAEREGVDVRQLLLDLDCGPQPRHATSQMAARGTSNDIGNRNAKHVREAASEFRA